MAAPPAEIFNKLIAQIAEEQKFVNYHSKIVPISSGGANYATILYNITIGDDKKVINLFAKIAATGEQLRAQLPKMYETEIFAYTKLLNLYEKLEERHKVPLEHRLSVPKFYGYHPKVYEETIVLENLILDGFMPYDRFKSIDWEYAKSAISQLAKMHALSFAYGEYYPEEYGKIIEERKIVFNEDGQMKVIFKMMIDKAAGVAREETKEKFQKYFESFDLDSFVDVYTRSKKRALCHGDFRPSNLMHRIREVKKQPSKSLLPSFCSKKSQTSETSTVLDIKIVDLQTLQGASPAIDLMYFIFIGSDEKFRAQYYDKLMDFYYAELHAAMKRLHINPEKVYTRADFNEELKEKMPFGLLISVFALPVVTVAEENAPVVGEDMGLTAFSVEKTSDLYAERMNGVINDYVKWGILK